MIVLDANILIRAVLGRRVWTLLQEYSSKGIRFCAPEIAYKDAETYLPALLQTKDRPSGDVSATLDYLRLIIEPVDEASYEDFEGEARKRLRGRDEEDWPVLAASLALRWPIWTEDTDFFGTGVAVWTTSRVEIYFQSLYRLTESDEI
jgi:predicted nucleic acid-binding protein